MKDTIYRQDAIDAIYEHEFSNWCDKDEVSTILFDLPSADPKTGKWVYDKYYAVHVCSECDEQALEEYTVNPRTLDRDYDEVLSEYCPHCGSRMLEIEDEDEDEEEDE